MSITQYQIEVSPGVTKTFYEVRVEALNRYTRKRMQFRRRGVPSRVKAELLARELWSACRKTRPDGAQFANWGQLWESFINYLYKNIRSVNNPNGFSPNVVRTKRSRLRRTEAWKEMHVDLVTPYFVINQLDDLEKQGFSRSVTNHILKEIKCMFIHYDGPNGWIENSRASGR